MNSQKTQQFVVRCAVGTYRHWDHEADDDDNDDKQLWCKQQLSCHASTTNYQCHMVTDTSNQLNWPLEKVAVFQWKYSQATGCNSLLVRSSAEHFLLQCQPHCTLHTAHCTSHVNISRWQCLQNSQKYNSSLLYKQCQLLISSHTIIRRNYTVSWWTNRIQFMSFHTDKVTPHY